MSTLLLWCVIVCKHAHPFPLSLSTVASPLIMKLFCLFAAVPLPNASNAFGGMPDTKRGPDCLCEGRFKIGDRVHYCDPNHVPWEGYAADIGTGTEIQRPPNHDEIGSCSVIGMRDGELALECGEYNNGVNGAYFCPGVDQESCAGICTSAQWADTRKVYWAMPCDVESHTGGICPVV